MLLERVKSLLRPAWHLRRDWLFANKLQRRIGSYEPIDIENLDFYEITTKASNFVESLRKNGSLFEYKYSASCKSPTLYGSAYACMTKRMLGELQDLKDEDRFAWTQYFDSFQSAETGLFIDSAVENKIFAQSDWWGARHLALHMVSAYTDLRSKPPHAFKFLTDYYHRSYIENWLNQEDWSAIDIGAGDFDNQIMNVACLLQYQRDTWADDEAALAVDWLKAKLKSKINPLSGMWGGFSTSDKYQRSRMVQFAYHLLPIFFYDGDFDFDAERIVPIVLQTQNRFGGFGVRPNSSACEDIDSIYLLIQFRPFLNASLQLAVDDALNKALRWVIVNQVEDGGFVFRLDEEFQFGSPQTYSGINEGAMLPTWFRMLSLMQIGQLFGFAGAVSASKCPGY